MRRGGGVVERVVQKKDKSFDGYLVKCCTMIYDRFKASERDINFTLIRF